MEKMTLYGSSDVDVQKPVPDIIGILHEYKIPISLIPSVFEKVLHDINVHTIPYSPNCLRIKDLAISEMTDKVTEPK